MTAVDQLHFGFEPPSDACAAPPKPAKKIGKKAEARVKKPTTQAADADADADAMPASAVSQVPQVPPQPTGDNLQHMAQTLDAHPDYKVLRRLPLTLHWGREPLSPHTRRVVVLDTETTGLDARTESIIELAMLAVDVDVHTGLPTGPVQTFEGFEDPGKPITAAITAITGITDSMVRGHRLDEAKIHAFVADADLIVAHNAGFDRPFVEARLPLFAHKAWACSFAGIDWKGLGSGSAKLEFLAHERGWFYDAHRALVDCHALLSVLAAPLGAAAGTAGTGLGALVSAASGARHLLRATGAPFEAKDSLKARGYRWDTEARVWWTALTSDAALQAEKTWLLARVYSGRAARVQVETQSALVQYSRRSGVVSDVLLSN